MWLLVRQTIAAVSYTHLDVYKRQVYYTKCRNQETGIFIPFENAKLINNLNCILKFKILVSIGLKIIHF